MSEPIKDNEDDVLIEIFDGDSYIPTYVSKQVAAMEVENGAYSGTSDRDLDSCNDSVTYAAGNDLFAAFRSRTIES